MKLTSRNTHRDIAYFYVGLIIAFSFSGIFLNHRQKFSSRRYKSEITEIAMAPVAKDSITDAFIANLTKTQNIADDLRRFEVRENTLRVSYVNHDLEADITTGKGQVIAYKIIPVLGHFTKLHIDTSQWWIYYSDIFGIAMLVIAFTGMFIAKGDMSFRQRGWKLALIGIIFPLIFLFLLS